MSISPAFALAALIPVLIGPLPQESAALTAKLCGGGEIGQRHRVSGQPPAVVQQPCHVIQVILDRLGACLDVAAVRIARAGHLLVHPLVQQFGGDLVVELVVEPADQSPDLVAPFGVTRHQRGVGPGFFDVFADRGAFGHGLAVQPQHRDLCRRVAPQKVGIGLPVALFHQFHLDLLLGEAQAHLAAEGGEGNVEQAGHDHPDLLWYPPAMPVRP